MITVEGKVDSAVPAGGSGGERGVAVAPTDLRMSLNTLRLEGFLSEDTSDVKAPDVGTIETKKEDDTIAALAEDSDDETEIKSPSSSRDSPLRQPAGLGLYNLAAQHLRHGRYSQAATLFDEIVVKERKKHGENHPAVGSALHNVALTHVKAGAYDKALPACKEAVRVRREVLREDSLDTASSLVLLGTIYSTRERGEDALRSFRQALHIRRSRLGENNPAVGKLYIHIGNVLFEEKEYLAALLNFEDALAIQKLSPVANHEKGEILSNVGTIRIKRKQYREASDAFEEALNYQLLEYRAGHPQLIYTLDCLGYALAKEGRNREALRMYKKILRGQIARHGASYVGCGATLNKMAAIHEEVGNEKDAIACTKQALAILEKALGPDDAVVIKTRKNWMRLEKEVGKPSAEAASV
mmetsp:Transcript_25553/g.55859  ORF Transcript_25553/g.55859 Transcript_25553/m.55859 type:complete len:413 (-) Transcript_25553:53-1291(-)